LRSINTFETGSRDELKKAVQVRVTEPMGGFRR
jgi:hypothetical protein